MTWFYFSLLSIFSLALAELAQQHLLKTKDGFSVKFSVTFVVLFEALLTLPLIFLLNQEEQLLKVFDPTILPWIIFSGLLTYFVFAVYFRSLQVENISLSLILISFSMVVSTVLGILLFAESLTPLKILGSALIMIAVVSIHWKNSAFEQNHLYALLAGLLFGFVYSLDKAIVVQTSPLIYLFWGFLWIGLIGLLFNLKESLKNLREKPFKSYRPLFVSGLGYFLYNIFTFSAYAVGGEVGRIDAINNSQVFLIILFEFFILRQRESTVRNLLTALLAFAGVAILGFF